MAEGQLPPQPLLTVTGPLTAGFSQSSLQNILNGSANTVSQLALRVIQYIQGVLAEAVNTGQTLAVKVATPISAGINQAQDTINQIGTQVASSITAATNVATGSCASGCDASGGAKYNEYQYNILQDFDVPASIFVENRDYPLNRGNMNLCFRGGWDSFYDAIAYKAKIQGTPPPPGCGKPGGPATEPGGTIPIVPIQPVIPPSVPFYAFCSSAGTAQIIQSNTPNIGGATQVTGPFQTYNEALDAANKLNCATPPVCPDGSPPPCTQPPTKLWYVLCGPNGPPQFCNTVDDKPCPLPQPPGEYMSGGPFNSLSEAQGWAAEACPTFVKQPTQPGSCMMIDLCDWQKFEDHLYKALCRFYEDCICKLTNEQHWELSDCDGELAEQVEPWKGQVVRIATDQTPDEIMALGQSQISSPGWQGVGDNPDPWG